MQRRPKLVVFDLDETLGHFSQLGLLMQAVKATAHRTMSIAEAIDIFPEVLRPGIPKMLVDLRDRKKNGELIEVIIYTNNCGHPSWANSIAEALNAKLGYRLFVQVIPGYVGRGSCRTTMDKTVHDLHRCIPLPPLVDVCFVDDAHHPGMINDSVYYIRLPPYYCPLTLDAMLDRCCTYYRVGPRARMFKRQMMKELNSYGGEWLTQTDRGSTAYLNDIIFHNRLQIFLNRK